MKKFLTLLLCIAALFTGCEKQEIQDLKDRIEKLEGENIAPIETQIESINASITDLKAVSNTLDTYTHVTTDMQKRASKIVGGFLDDLIIKEDDNG